MKIDGKYEVEKSNIQSIDFKGIKSRLRGAEIRDCLVVLSPKKSFVFLLKRYPLDDSVLDSLLKGGHGYIDINAGRISTSETLKGGKGELWSHKRDGTTPETPEVPQSNGRFPTNLILLHDAKCYVEGTKKVKTGTAHYDNMTSVAADSGAFVAGGWKVIASQKEGKAGFADSNGIEEIPNWVCEKECPVSFIDSQSGILGSSYCEAWDKKLDDAPSRVLGLVRGRNKGSPGYKDTGGASRFFKQVESFDVLMKYLHQMTVSDA